MKNPLLLTASCLLGVLLSTSCSTDTGDVTDKTTDQLQENRKEMAEARTENREEWREERTEAMKELRDLRATLENRLIREQERLKDGIKDADRKSECQALIAELGTNIARIDASLLKMEVSSATDWQNVKAEARRAQEETKSWWSRQRELIDKKTAADNDNDGH
ncbi:MAG: hypothetical protein IPL52_15200 [Flavobacteriales bacterium]|nr:hypothetical protein [Flavobacteriales bacterium]